MYKLKQVAKRGSAFIGAVSLLAGIGSSALPAFVSADALNPLTERSLSLSSSSPGWSFKDGSNNTTYAPPNSGANGQKTGNFFSFRTTSQADGVASPGHTAKIKGMTFQYCIQAAGDCTAPGNDGHTGASRNADGTSTSDLNVTTSSPTEISSANWTTIQARQSGVTAGLYAKTPNADNSEGNFIVLVNGTVSAGWAMTAGNLEQNGTISAGTATGKNNLITITNSAGVTINSQDQVQVMFFGTNTNYITNPGAGAFFVRINDYDTDTNADAGQPDDTHALDPTQSLHIIDGGVTVANVMNESISIQTKVLETMQFSVGTYDPDTFDASNATFQTNTGLTGHNQCDTILKKDPLSSTYATDPNNVLHLGDSTAEYSLSTTTPHEVSSYWRLSSNSSGGAVVYYTGHTLTNTEGDAIQPLNDTSSHFAQVGTEQFGLGIDAGSATGGSPSHNLYNVDSDTSASKYATGSGNGGDFASYVTGVNDPTKAHLPQLYPLVPVGSYGAAAGTLANGSGPKFAFNSDADAHAVPIASETTDVVNCVTAKMRYVADIAATTPAGIYTTKVNYVASPQY